MDCSTDANRGKCWQKKTIKRCLVKITNKYEFFFGGNATPLKNSFIKIMSFFLIIRVGNRPGFGRHELGLRNFYRPEPGLWPIKDSFFKNN
jgi:hypothetical protein